MPVNKSVINSFKKAIPDPLKSSYKGQSGRVAIVGGSKDYAGAPYFSAISALRSGADLAHVFTTKDASLTIKSYSPELIVQPILDCEDSKLDMEMISRIHCLIIGPGLGRSETAFQAVKNSIESAKLKKIPIVIDADGLFVLNSDTSIVNGYEKCILTPNEMEFKRLYDATFENNCTYNMHRDFDTQCEAVIKLAKKLNNLTIMKKGSIDIISDGHQTITNDLDGSRKRCGGIGDILSGITGTYAFWCDSAHNADENIFQEFSITNSMMIAAYSASAVTKWSSQNAYAKFHRSLIAGDIIEEIANVIYMQFDH